MPSKLVKVQDSKSDAKEHEGPSTEVQPYRKYNYLKLSTIKQEGQTCDSNGEALKVGDHVWTSEFGIKWCLECQPNNDFDYKQL